jgi:hypothetical protein
MKRYSAPHAGLPYFLPRSKDRGVIPASASLRVLTLAPEGVVLPKNPMQRGRVRFEAMSLIKRPTESARDSLQRAAKIRENLAKTDIPGYTHRENGQAVEVTSSRWFARMRLLLQEIGERLEARRQRFTYEVSAIDPVEPLPALAEDDTQRERQRPPEDVPGTVEQLTDTVVIAPGAPARA